MTTFILFLLVISSQAQNVSIRFHYLGHSSFLIVFDDEISILTDYGKPNAWVEYGWNSPIYDIGDFTPTIVTYSHLHADHFDSTRIPKEVKYILKKSDTLNINYITIKSILTSENDLKLKNNTSYLFNYKGLEVLHLGDCQANIINIDSVENRKYIESNIPFSCDIVLLPIESTSKFIPQVEKFIELIHPKVVIPMHYWSDDYKLEFLKYTEEKAISEKKKYRTLKLDCAEYIYTKSERNDSIFIVDMERSKLISK